MMKFNNSRAGRVFKVVALGGMLLGATAAHADIKLTPVERTGSASGPAEELQPMADAAPVKAAKPAKPAKAKKVAAAKPCKKKKGGGGVLGFIKKTGLAGMLVDQAVGGGMGGYAANQVTSVAVDEAAKAEESGGSTKC
jgi:hypothetical protein